MTGELVGAKELIGQQNEKLQELKGLVGEQREKERIKDLEFTQLRDKVEEVTMLRMQVRRFISSEGCGGCTGVGGCTGERRGSPMMNVIYVQYSPFFLLF